jgi:glycosyltransferase involved in cell wall biosynthesis
MKKVIIFRNAILPPSETFIKEQALALSDWRPTLMGYRVVTNGLDLTGLNVKWLPGMNSGRLRRALTKLQQLRNKPHKPTVNQLKAEGADIIHAHFGTDAIDIWPSANAAGLPMVVTLHGYDINIHREWWESGKGGLRRRAYPCRLLAMAKSPRVRFIAVSNAIKKRAIAYGIPEAKITTCYIGVNIDRFKPSGLPIGQRPPHILYVGRMVEGKNPLMMLRAYAEVRNNLPEATLTMIGDGPLLIHAKSLANQLNLPVEFLGAQPPDEVIRQLNRSSVLCLTSIATPRGDAEGLPISILEAQASGVPVVTSALGGTTEAIIANETGYSFQPGDTASFVTSVVDILSDTQRRTCLSKSAINNVRRCFNITECARQLSQIYSMETDHDRNL